MEKNYKPVKRNYLTKGDKVRMKSGEILTVTGLDFKDFTCAEKFGDIPKNEIETVLELKEKMKVLLACEESQAVCVELRKLGHKAYSCDEKQCSGGHPEWHLQCDVMDVINDGWDMMIAFPPCTYLSSVQTWLCRTDAERTMKRIEAALFFMKLYNAKIPKIAVENPTGVMTHVFREPDQIIHPYYFGGDSMKRTGLWLKGLPLLQYTKYSNLFEESTLGVVPPPEKTWFRKSNGKIQYQRQVNKMLLDSETRSKLSPFIARAMAEQWGKLDTQ